MFSNTPFVSSWKSWKQMIFWADDFNGFGTNSAADCPTFLVQKLSRFKVCSCTRFDRRKIVTLALYVLCRRRSLSATPANSELVFRESGAVMHPYPLVVRWSATWHCTAALLFLKEFHRRRLYHHVPHIHGSSSELKLLLAKEIFGSSELSGTVVLRRWNRQIWGRDISLRPVPSGCGS